MAIVVAPPFRRTRLHIHFKEQDGVVSIEKVFAPGPGSGGETELNKQEPPNPTGTHIAEIVTVPGSGPCVVVNIGNGFYFKCFD
jgi:hypothetical protein